jgi:ABC-type antimicrobial peptide transport system permease subunit
MYFSSLQVSPQRSSTLVVRTTGDPLNSIASIRQQLWSLDKNLTAANVETLENLLTHSLSDRRFSMILFAIFAFIAIFFSAVGIYSLMAFSVNQRMQEMGIRMALGAQRKHLLRMLLKHGMGLVTIGLVLGLALSFACSRIISSLLYEMSPADPFIFFVGSLFVCLVSLVASLIPTWKAANVSPLRALRYE